MNVENVYLDSGGHNPGDGKGCVMEWVSVKWLMSRHGYTLAQAWDMLTDSPDCTERLIYRAARVVNDRLPEDQRQRLVPLIDRLMVAHSVSDPVKSWRCRVRVSCWAARSVLHLIDDDERRAVAVRAIETAERWLRGEADQQAAAAAASAAAASAAYAAAAASAAAASAAYAYASASAAAYAASAAEIDLVLWLDELLDQWEKARAEEGALHEEVNA